MLKMLVWIPTTHSSISEKVTAAKVIQFLFLEEDDWFCKLLNNVNHFYIKQREIRVENIKIQYPDI